MEREGLIERREGRMRRKEVLDLMSGRRGEEQFKPWKKELVNK